MTDPNRDAANILDKIAAEVELLKELQGSSERKSVKRIKRLLENYKQHRREYFWEAS